MGYLRKRTVLRAYEALSHLSEDPTQQGATQTVSAIRYFVALDSFYVKFQRYCNTRDKSDRNEYADLVGRICDVCPNLYTTNFYYPLKKHDKDFGVGSNFYSAGQVNLSNNNQEETFVYPKRTPPLFSIKNGVLISDEKLYSNLNSYLKDVQSRVAFVLWLLRKTSIDSGRDLFGAIRGAMEGVYSNELVDILMGDEERFETELRKYDLSLCDDYSPIREEDIKGMFDVKEKSPNTTLASCGGLNFKARELYHLSALRAKPFMLLAGISGTGKSRIVRKLAQATVTEELQRAEGYIGDDFANDRWKLHSPANFELIQVKPNWHSSMDVVGYLSNIPSPHYVFTPFIEFVAKAWRHQDVPFFLCLDEMNLAPVEEYFAEFLSAIESRSFEDEEYMTDPIIKSFNSFGSAKDEKGTPRSIGDMMVNDLFPDFKASDTESEIAKVIKHFRIKGLTLPKNLIVVGTVNMDETTFSFSRKVLDRAMSVEMNEVNYDDFLASSTDNGLKAIVKGFEDGAFGEGANLNRLLVDRHIEAKEIIGELGDDAHFAIDYLKRVNALLEGTPFKLGYRAANEALIYLQSSKDFCQSDRRVVLDNFTLMKILSRIEGDEAKLKITDSETDKERISNAGVNVDEAKVHGGLNILTALRNIIKQQLGEYYDTNAEEDAEGNAENGLAVKVTDRLRSIKKIDSMLTQLSRDHFVSFWS